MISAHMEGVILEIESSVWPRYKMASDLNNPYAIAYLNCF